MSRRFWRSALLLHDAPISFPLSFPLSEVTTESVLRTLADGSPVLTISGTPVLTATEDVAYAGFTVTAENGTEPYVFSLVGTWPAGIDIDPDTGEVSGTPTESGTFAGLSVRVTDDNSDTDDLPTFTLEVAAAGVGRVRTLAGLGGLAGPGGSIVGLGVHG